MKAVMISIQPKWVEKIVNGKKTIEVRKTVPKLETPFKCYIYETQGATETPWVDEDGHFIFKGRGQVIGEFVCDKITDISVVVRNCNENYNEVYHNDECKGSCLTWKELQEYGKGKPLYGWHISNLQIYDKPKELGEFRKPCSDKYIKKYKYCQGCKHGLGADLADCWNTVNCPPQSWCYVEEN